MCFIVVTTLPRTVNAPRPDGVQSDPFLVRVGKGCGYVNATSVEDMIGLNTFQIDFSLHGAVDPLGLASEKMVIELASR